MATKLSNFFFDKELMIVNGLNITDQETIIFFKDLERESDLEEKFKKILKLGVVATKIVGTAEKLDYIEKEFNKLDSRFDNKLDMMLAELSTKYEMMFGDDGKFSDLLKEHFGDNGKVVKDLFDPYREGTPLYYLIKEVRSEIDEMKKQLILREGEELVRQNTTLKGFDFQDYCEDILNNIVRVHGDCLENTSTKVGKLTRSKKGDFVITLGNNIGKKCVIELKDVDRRLTTDDIQVELEEAKKNREADYAILVTRHVESLPKSTGWFNEFNGHK